MAEATLRTIIAMRVIIPETLTATIITYLIIATSIDSVSFVNLLTIVPFGVTSKKLSFVLIIALVISACKLREAAIAKTINVNRAKKLRNSVAADTAA